MSTTLLATRADWMRLLNTAGAFVKEVKITVEGGRALCLAVDPAHVAIIKGEIDCGGTFTGSICVNVEKFIKALNACGGDEPQIEIDDYLSDMKIIGTAKINMPLEADLGEIKDINRAMFEDETAIGTFNPVILEQPIGYCLWAKEQIISIKMNDRRLTFSMGSDRNTAEISSDVPCEGPDATSTYPLDYFSEMLKQTKGAETVTVEIPQDDYPMLARWGVGTGVFSVVIAPRVEQE